jgi:hypothetical protein
MAQHHQVRLAVLADLAVVVEVLVLQVALAATEYFTFFTRR